MSKGTVEDPEYTFFMVTETIPIFDLSKFLYYVRQRVALPSGLPVPHKHPLEKKAERLAAIWQILCFFVVVVFP